jgi:ATP adenylyltransferase/5',5'''-P-1,P-4-tetraphosphate phosphorylase II
MEARVVVATPPAAPPGSAGQRRPATPRNGPGIRGRRGVRFVIGVGANLARKAAARGRQSEPNRAGGPPPDPFLPYEPALFVADLTETHLGCVDVLS